MGKRSFSLWLMPSGDIYHRLSRIILRLGQRLACPAFEPHVTLLGGLDGTEAQIRSKSRILAAHLKPVVIRLGEVGYLDEFFRCLFVHVAQTPSLLQAYEAAVEAFRPDSRTEFMPHLSLVYGNLSAATKLRLIEGLGTPFSDRFKVRSLYFYSTMGPPETWYRIGHFALGEDCLA